MLIYASRLDRLDKFDRSDRLDRFDFHTETSTNQVALFDYDCTIFLLVKDRLVPKPLLYHVT